MGGITGARNRVVRQGGVAVSVLLTALMLLTAGCASNVRTQLNTFMAPSAVFGEGSIAVRPTDESLQDSLEFQLYQSKVEERLQGLGYVLAPPEEAEYIARLGYGVEELRPRMRRSDVVFTTGFGHYYRWGGIGFTLGDGPDYQDEFLRRLTLAITRTPEDTGGEPQRIYEATALSQGACPVMSVVFDEMLAAVFQNFPGDNGAVRTVTVRGDARCR